MRRHWLFASVLLAAACTVTTSDIERYGSGWSITYRLREDQVAMALARSGALVDSLRAEGYRLKAERSSATARDGRTYEAHGWTLEGKHRELGHVRVDIDVDTDPSAERQVVMGVRFASHENQPTARVVFGDRFDRAARDL